MAPISITAEPFVPVEVDLWGTVYRTVPVTRSVQKKLDALSGDIEAAGDDGDKVIEAIGQLLDALFEKTTAAKRASVLVSKKWKADELQFDRLLAFLSELRQAERPT